MTKAVEGATEEGEPDTYYPTGKRNYMRTVPADDIQGVAGANWAYESKGAPKAYVLDDQSLYGHGVPQVFNNAFAELGGEVLGAEGYDPKAPDYQALMTKIADMGPDIVYVGATVDNNAAEGGARHALVDAGRPSDVPRAGRADQPGVHRWRG